MKNIQVSYNQIKALRGVDFDLYRGEIHALVGEHRAGKSTLVKILSGAVRKNKGEIIYNGKRIDYFTPSSALEHKIGMVYQNINVIPSLNAVENIFAGQMHANFWGKLCHSEMIEHASRLFSYLNVDIELEQPISLLTTDKQHMVEIARLVSVDPELIIFDEVSSKLTPEEMETIYRLIFDFKNKNKSIIYISHNMDEIFEFADRVTILKDGYRRGTEEIKDIDKLKLIKLTYSFMLSREELKQDNRELYFFKKYNENIIKNLPVGGIILDAENKIYLINFAALTILELAEQIFNGHDFQVIFAGEKSAALTSLVKKIRNHEQYTVDEVSYGTDKILKINSFPFKDEDYQFLGTIILIEDITRDSYLKEYLLRTERIASVAELAAGVAHEINNPLGVIQNYLVLLKNKTIDTNALSKLAKIEEQLQGIVDITGNLLSFSRLKELPKEKIDLIRVLDEAVSLLDHKLKRKHIHLVRKYSHPELLIIGDENKLKQVFINLLINSMEAVLDGGIIQLQIFADRSEGFIEVKIIDNGYGIPKDIIPKIFNPFYSTKAHKNNAGLGLSICQHIIESHQGLISCQSGELTTFSIRLPLISTA
ncbi:MAG: ATP-binding cassette domain-containing protein [Spirochaetales bacterium]|nr:ATP-binding cassette domain-containing protein [Spirochaetales bacterium]